MTGSTEHMGPAAQRHAQIGLAGLAFTHFQKAGGEIGARHGIVRTERQDMPVGVGGGRIFPIQQQEASELFQYFRMTRRNFASMQKNRAGLAAFVLVQVQARKDQLQINGFGRRCQTTFDDGDGLFDATGIGKLSGEFLEGRRKQRRPRRGLAQLFNRFRAAPCAAQRRAKQGFDTRVAAAACRLLELRDRLSTTVLSDQGPSQDRHGGGVGPTRSQDFSGESLRLGELSLSQREGGAFEHLGAGMLVSAANGRKGRMLRHSASHHIMK
jgi:hypothetical protein